MEAAEAAIRHGQHGVAWPGLFRHRIDQRIDVVADLDFPRRSRKQRGRIPIQIGGMNKDQVRLPQAVRQRFLHDAAAHGLRSWIEYREDSSRRTPLPHPFQGGADRRRVMSEVVVDLYPGGNATQLHAPPDALELTQRLDRRLRIDTDMPGRSDGCKSIHLVVGSLQS